VAANGSGPARTAPLAVSGSDTLKSVDFLLQTLERNGVEHIFGNPGTTEIPLVRACEQRSAIRYVVALSELAAVPMADGYARAGRRLGVVNLHVAPGLGNGMGALYTAGIAGTPLLVLLGGQDRRFLHTDPILSGPLEKMAATVCKAVFGISTPYDTAANVRRALRAALTPPYSPVALVCPADVLEEEVGAEPQRVSAPCLPGLDREAVKACARFLDEAKRPAFIAAEDVHWSGASAALEAVAKALAAPVYAAPYTAILPVSARSQCYSGYLPPSHRQIAERLDAHDALIFIGGRGLRTTLYSEARLPQRKAWIGFDALVQPAHGEFELAYAADPARSLASLHDALEKRAPDIVLPGRPLLELPPHVEGSLHPTRAVARLLERFERSIWFDESGLSTSDVRQWMTLAAGDYIINGSGGIGWGLAAAVGAAIGRRDRHVVAAIGDGSALYASEALWTAAHCDAAMLLVVFANRRYATLNEAAGRLAGSTLESFTIEPPALDWSGLARLHGWNYARASTEDALSRFLDSYDFPPRSNVILELALEPAARPVTADRHF
jgi:benzoylformate decarboxylase